MSTHGRAEGTATNHEGNDPNNSFPNGAAAAAVGRVGVDNEDESESLILSDATMTSELAFLVTHWLAEYGSLTGERDAAAAAHTHPDDDNVQTHALQRVRQAAAALASAFATLGVFGTIPGTAPLQRSVRTNNKKERENE